MPTYTEKLRLPIPAGNEGHNREAHEALIQAIEAGAAPVDSPEFIGTPKAPTPAAGTNNTEVATTAFVKQAVDKHAVNYVTHTGYAAATNTGNAYAVTLSPAPTSLIDGMGIAFKAAAANTGAVTMNVNTLGAVPIVKANGEALDADSIKAGSIYTIRYNATTGNFILQGEGGDLSTADKTTAIQRINALILL